MREDPRHIVIFSLCLVAALLILDVLLRYHLNSIQYGNTAKVNAVMEHSISDPITVWGASTARVHINPNILQDSLGLSCLNLGLDGTSFDQYRGLLVEYASFVNPGATILLIIDVNGLGKRSSLYQSYAWLHHINNNNIYTSLVGIDRDLVMKARFVPMYYITAFDRRFLVRSIREKFFPRTGKRELENRGYHPRRDSWIVESAMFRESFFVEIDKSVLNNLKTLIYKLLGKKCKVVVVIPPVYFEGRGKILNISDFTGAIESIGESRDLLILNYLNDSIIYKKELFANNTHLNANGADDLSKMLAGDLKKWWK